MGHPVEAGGFRHHGVGAGDQGLRGDHAGSDGQYHGNVPHGRGHHLEERVQTVHAPVGGIVPMIEHPRSLAEVAQYQCDLDERPSAVDVAAANMAHVGIQRLGAGGRQEHGAHHGDAGHVVVTEQEADAIHRVERSENAPVVAQIHEPHDGQEREPYHHHGAESTAYALGAVRLHGKQHHDDHDGDHQRKFLVLRHHMFQRRQRFQAFHGGTDRYRGSQHGIGEERRATEHGGNRKPCTVFANQRIQRENAAFALVVDTHGDQHVLDGGDERNRPEHQRQHAEHGFAIGVGQAALTVEEGLHGIQRRSADIAIHHAKCDHCHGKGDFVGAGLQSAPPAAQTASTGRLIELGGFLLLFLVLFDELLALFFGQDLVRDLGRLRIGRCVEQRFLFVWLVRHNASSKWRAFQPTPQNNTQGGTLGAPWTVVKSSGPIQPSTIMFDVCSAPWRLSQNP